jgi:eukaryotic-like serine/threonine-protein kinase
MTPQSCIGHFRVVCKLGEGGMGAVYRATDTKLNRDVAIKILPDSVADDPDRLARFAREAQVLASLNHPNIAQIYGVEERALVMELVEGEELPVPQPIAVAIDYARQIAEALEAAHEKGIVHRDLKPANIKVTPEGVVKVLDFGLAAVTQGPAPGAGDPLKSPTLTMRATEAGVIMGTAAYMSPEQAAGKAVDKRADIWSFGVVLWEMLTGRRLFAGETLSHTLADVLRAPIDFSELPADTPAGVRQLLRRCLDRNLRNRLRDIGEARVMLEASEAEGEPAAPAPVQSRALPWIVGGVVVAVGLAGAGAAWLLPQPPAGLEVTFPLNFPAGAAEPGGYALVGSPSLDGRSIAFTASGADRKESLWVRHLGSATARQLEDTGGALAPFWSPDGQFVAYFASPGQLKKAPVAGGPPQSLSKLDTGGLITSGNGGTWSRDGVIVVGLVGELPLMRVSAAAGGEPRPVFPLDTAAGEVGHSWPQFLPDGRHLLYFSRNRDPEKSAIYVQEMGSAQRVEVMRSRYHAMWAPPGYLVFPRGEGSLFAQGFDLKSFRLSGEPVRIVDNVTSNATSGRSAFTVQESVLLFREGQSYGGSQVAWYDRGGNRLGAVGKPADYAAIRLAPDDKRAVVILNAGLADEWMLDLGTGGLTRVTTSGNVEPVPAPGPWSPDAERLIVNSAGGAGAAEFTIASGKTVAVSGDLRAEDWSPDGKLLLCNDTNSRRLFTLAPESGARPHEIGATPYVRHSFHFSPDAQSVAYTSEESGRREVFVAAFPSFGEKRQVSLEGGSMPLWRKDGKELFFLESASTVMAASVEAGPKLQTGAPKALFKLPSVNPNLQTYAVSGDGQRFLVVEHPRDNVRTMVMVNWAEGLKR